MEINQSVIVDAPLADVWDLVLDVPRVGLCVPGAEQVTQIGPDAYSGVLKVKVGAIAVNLNGQITIVERNPESHFARMQVEAVDRRIRGSVRATAKMQLRTVGERQTEMLIETDAAILGKLGQFGQAVMKKKTDQVLAEFAGNLARSLAPAPAAVVGAPTGAPAAVAATAPVNGTPMAGTTVSAWPASAPAAADAAALSAWRDRALTGLQLVGLGTAVAGAVRRRDSGWGLVGICLVLIGARRRSAG